MYGGFVRDWVVRGRPAEDVDALVPPGKSAAAVVAALRAAAARRGLACVGERVKGAARAVTFDDPRCGAAHARARASRTTCARARAHGRTRPRTDRHSKDDSDTTRPTRIGRLGYDSARSRGSIKALPRTFPTTHNPTAGI